MKKRSKYRLYVWLMVLSSIMLVITVTMTSLKIIRGGKGFTRIVLEEEKTFVVNTIRFGHGIMAHMGSENYDTLIALALKSKFISHLAILDKEGRVISQSQFPEGLLPLKRDEFKTLKDGGIFGETKNTIWVTYQAKREILPNAEHMRHHATFKGHMRMTPNPGWFLVGLDTSAFKRHYHDMVVQTLGTGGAFLLLGVLIIIFLGIVQRYELAHLSIQRLGKIKRLLGYFVPQTAKTIIEKEPDKKGLLDKYIQDATILFLDVESFSLLLGRYSQERINRAIETYFSVFLNLIQKNMGDINETAGDGMMVIFLDSGPSTHARNAIQTALEIREHCLKTAGSEDPELFPIQINIGIHTGRVYLGSTKMRGIEGERWTFTASGAVTIMAARLAQYANHGQILIGEETARRVEGLFSLNHLGKVSLKNIKDPGEVYEIPLLADKELLSSP